MCKNKATWRVAVDIHQKLASRNRADFSCKMPDTYWQRCRPRIAQQRGWHLAARQCETDLRNVIDLLLAEFTVMAESGHVNDPTRKCTS